jgi:ribonuclease BN (tRNA processing enzyme)
MLLDGILLDDLEFRVRAVTLDHGTPVLAYAYEPATQFHVRKERLLAGKLEPGPWLNELKKRLLAEQYGALITLPDGRLENVERLAAELILETQADGLVYATDFADTQDNRRRLITLAQDSHSLFCEATFLQRDWKQAMHTGHLTARACGEIARQARVRCLIPFHFSRRYEDHPAEIYREIAAACPQVVIPRRP